MLIHNIKEVYKLSIYGYQTNKTRFFYIEVYNAENIKKLGELCLDGIDGVHFQPYEVHIDVFQHFYSDYGLAGMDWLTVDELVYRGGCQNYGRTSTYQKSTRTELECDCVCFKIRKNTQEIGKEFGSLTLPPVYKL